MSRIQFTWLMTSTAICFLLLTATACKKATPALSVEATRQQNQSWGIETLVRPYENGEFTDPKWDSSAKLALNEFSRVRAKTIATNEPWMEIISTNAAAAVHAGCDDPMVNYLFIKFAMDQTNSKETFTSAFYQTALDMESSSYPPIRKFYAGFRAIEQYSWANKYPTNWPTELSALSRRTSDHLNAVLNDPNTPPAEIYDACHEYLGMWQKSKATYPKIWQTMEPLVFKNWPNASSSWLLKGDAYIRLAWLARGSGYADTVTDNGWKEFSADLATAQAALERAWKLNPLDVRIPAQMMTVVLGQGGNRDQMEVWFNRAMDLDPDNYEACRSKLYYLEPKWYGSTEAQLAFGRECVQSQKWGGRVPLTLLDAHFYVNARNDKSEQTNYWKQPGVWPDVQSAFDRFFELNPDAKDWYNNYAWYAYHAEQWEKLNELIPKLGPINYDFFGGTNAFNTMLALAKAHADKPK